jgi:hypothetical protein
MPVIAVPGEQLMEIFKTFASQRNAEAYYEMTQAVNSNCVTYKTKNQIAGNTTIKDYAQRILK